MLDGGLFPYGKLRAASRRVDGTDYKVGPVDLSRSRSRSWS